jgi:arylsulfatase A-like enzyme
MPDVTDIAYPVSLYDGAITYSDNQVARILDALRRTGQEDDTLILITSDHGEGFGEHKIYFNHFGLHEEQTRVPLILYYPRYPRHGVVVDSLVGHVDIVPTVLDTIGLPIPNRLEGYSLLPVIRGEPASRPQMICLQMFEEFAMGFVTPNWRFIRYMAKSPTPPFLVDFEENDLELYDLIADPAERVNLAQQPDAEAIQQIRQFQDALTVWQESGGTAYHQEQLALDDATEQMLRDLGY